MFQASLKKSFSLAHGVFFIAVINDLEIIKTNGVELIWFKYFVIPRFEEVYRRLVKEEFSVIFLE